MPKKRAGPRRATSSGENEGSAAAAQATPADVSMNSAPPVPDVSASPGSGKVRRTGEEEKADPLPPPAAPKRLDHVSSWVASGRVRPENFDDVEEDGRLDSLVRAVPPAR